MNHLRLLIAALLFAAGPVLSGPLEDGVDAALRQDYATAVRLWRPLAEAGHAYAQYNLGYMYRTGRGGLPQDDKQALFWYLQAAAQGEPESQNALGIMYEKGEGVPQDNTKSISWYRKAADQGFTSAQYWLGDIYERGRLVPKNDQKSYFWFLLASVSKTDYSDYWSKLAVEGRDRVDPRLTPQQRAAAQADARNWKPTKK